MVFRRSWSQSKAFRADSTLGCAGLLSVYRAGNVTLSGAGQGTDIPSPLDLVDVDPPRGQQVGLLDVDTAYTTWVRRWTAEEGRHSMVLYGYITVSRMVDPVMLERGRMVQVSTGRLPDIAVTDPTTFCTWEMFRAHREDEWVASIEPLLERFPGERQRLAVQHRLETVAVPAAGPGEVAVDDDPVVDHQLQMLGVEGLVLCQGLVDRIRINAANLSPPCTKVLTENGGDHALSDAALALQERAGKVAERMAARREVDDHPA